MNNETMTIFYDRSCKLCRSEIEAIEQHDELGIFTKVDCSAADFDDSPYLHDGIRREDMMNYLHVQTDNGEWFVGVDAFELIYRKLGLTSVAYMWGGDLVRPFTTKIYPWVARNRGFISKSGIPFLFQMWGRCAARRAQRRSSACHDGQCRL